MIGTFSLPTRNCAATSTGAHYPVFSHLNSFCGYRVQALLDGTLDIAYGLSALTVSDFLSIDSQVRARRTYAKRNRAQILAPSCVFPKGRLSKIEILRMQSTA